MTRARALATLVALVGALDLALAQGKTTGNRPDPAALRGRGDKGRGRGRGPPKPPGFKEEVEKMHEEFCSQGDNRWETYGPCFQFRLKDKGLGKAEWDKEMEAVRRWPARGPL